MKTRTRLATVAACILLGGAIAPGGAAAVDINVNLGAYPPPPSVVFEREPEIVVVPSTRVYYVPRSSDYDLYRYGDRWYLNRNGYWYRARTYRGPFSALEPSRVPGIIIGLPAEYRRHPAHPHGGPPGQLKKGGNGPHGRPNEHGAGQHPHSNKGGKKK